MDRGDDAKRPPDLGHSEALDLAERLARAACQQHAAGEENARPRGTVGDYRILRELGRGGQGTVYLAGDLRLGREVALKILPWTTGLAEQRRLRREAEITARLDLPQVCKVFEVGRFEGGTYVAMQHVLGETVAARIREARGVGPVDVLPRPEPPGPRVRQRIDAVLTFVAKVARAVHRVHLEGVVHRDLKPANLMLTPDGDPVILDFGLARADDHGLETLTATGDVFGTPAYMAPELLGDEPRPADQASDVWALGCILWELLFAVRPFDGPTRTALLEAIRSQPLPAGRRLLPELPPELETVLETALERDLARRYPTAEALAEDLQRVVQRRPVAARRSSWSLRARRAVQRHPLRFAALALGFLLVTVTPTAVAVQAKLAEAEIREEQLRAARLADLALGAISDTLVELGDSALAQLPWEVERRRGILARAEQLLIDLESDPAVAEGVVAERIGIHYELARLGDGTQRDTDAERHMTIALELLERHPEADLAPDRRLEIERTAHASIANSRMRQGFLADAERILDLAEARPLLRDDAFARAGFLHLRAQIASLARDPARALELADAAARELDRADSTVVDIPPHHDIERAEIQITRIAELGRLRRHDEAADALDPAIAALDARPPARHAINHRFTFTSCLNQRAMARMVVKRFDEARLDIDRSVAIHDDLLALAPDHPDFLFQAGQSRVIRSDLLHRMGARPECEAEVHAAFALLRREVPGMESSAHVSICFLRSLLRLEHITGLAMPDARALREDIVHRAVSIGRAALPRFPDNGRLLTELSATVRKLAELQRDADDLAAATSLLAGHCTLLEERLGDATTAVAASERFRCLRDLGRVADLRRDPQTSHRAWSRAYQFAVRAAAEEAPGLMVQQAPYYALHKQLAAAFELGLWSEIEAACANPMRHFADYIATFSGSGAIERWLGHPLHDEAARFVKPTAPGPRTLRLRLAVAVLRLHVQLRGEHYATGPEWERVRQAYRDRWIALLLASARELPRVFR